MSHGFNPCIPGRKPVAFLYPHGELCLRTSGPSWKAFSFLNLRDGTLKPRKQKDKIDHKQTLF